VVFVKVQKSRVCFWAGPRPVLVVVSRLLRVVGLAASRRRWLMYASSSLDGSGACVHARLVGGARRHAIRDLSRGRGVLARSTLVRAPAACAPLGRLTRRVVGAIV